MKPSVGRVVNFDWNDNTSRNTRNTVKRNKRNTFKGIAQSRRARATPPSNDRIERLTQKSSLPLQIVIWLNYVSLPVTWTSLLILYIYKGVYFPYSPAAFELELTAIFPYLLIELTRLYLGKQPFDARNSRQQNGRVCADLDLPGTIFGLVFRQHFLCAVADLCVRLL